MLPGAAACAAAVACHATLPCHMYSRGGCPCRFHAHRLQAIITPHRCCLPQNDPLRRFYTSLKQQRPDSEMATK